MKNKWIVIIAFVIFFSGKAIAESGDIAFWLPLRTEDASQCQVKRNIEYFSIKLHSVYAYYKSGFFENIKKLAVVTETAISDENKIVQSTMLNKIWQQLDKEGDFIGINDHLVVLSPATVSNVKIKVSYRGIGEDRFKFVFDALLDPTLKTALTLSPSTSTTLSALSPTVKKLLASSYTENNPRQVLDISQSYIIYSNTVPLKGDSLREGYLIIVSAREGKSDDLSKILTLKPQDIRLNNTDTGLEYKQNEIWKPFRRNSYVVLSVTKTDVRGENEFSNWFARYSEAERFTEEKLQAGEEPVQVRKEAINYWRDGNALLYVDPNYIEAERKSIKSYHLSVLQSYFSLQKMAKVKFDPKELDVSPNFLKIAKEYKQAVNTQAAQVIVQAQGENGSLLPDIKFRVTGLDDNISTPIEGKTNAHGELIIKDLPAGKYSIETMASKVPVSNVFIVDPKDSKKFDYNKDNKMFMER